MRYMMSLLTLALLSTAAFAAPSLTQADVDAWLDGLVPRAIRAGDIAGGVVVIVKDGEILTERGFGYADVAARIPVDPHTTVFRPGSISKVFTWTAVMQLVEQGKLDLDADINRYLDFSLPPYAGKPVTMRNVMTHAAGFEEKLKDIVRSQPAPSLQSYLKEWIPQRIFPPGAVPAYSNYASALAGYVVERVAQQPYDDYMDRHVLGPLDMTQSTFRQPVPESLLPQLSKGYLRRSGPVGYFEYLGPAPAGSLSATGHDMAKFMIAHLQNGEYRGARILSTETALQMHAIQPKVYPALHGMALGFYEHSRNGHRVVAHNGGTQFFHSDLHLFLDDGVGIFISLNSPGIDGAASGLHEALFHGFADRYFPTAIAEQGEAVDSATAVEHARLIAGTWEDSRHSNSSILRIFTLLGPLTITANEDGTINFPDPRLGTSRWREVEPFVWREVNGQDKIQVLTENGRPTLLGLDMAPPAGFQPAPAWRSPAWMVPALVIAIASLLISGLTWPVAAIVRRRFEVQWLYSGRAALIHRVSRALNLGTAVLFLTVVGILLYMANAYDRLSSGMDAWLLLLKIAALCVFVAAVLAAIGDLIISWSLRRSWFGKLWSINVAASCAFVLWIALVFNFANFSSNY